MTMTSPKEVFRS